MAPLAARLGKSVEDTARRILDIATDKVIPGGRAADRRVQARSRSGAAGGRGRRRGRADPVRRRAARLGLRDLARTPRSFPRSASRSRWCARVVERVIRIRRRRICGASAARRSRRWSGSAPRRAMSKCTIEVDPQTQRVRATAMGASEMRARDLLKTAGRGRGARDRGRVPEGGAGRGAAGRPDERSLRVQHRRGGEELLGLPQHATSGAGGRPGRLHQGAARRRAGEPDVRGRASGRARAPGGAWRPATTATGCCRPTRTWCWAARWWISPA